MFDVCVQGVRFENSQKERAVAPKWCIFDPVSVKPNAFGSHFILTFFKWNTMY